MLDIPRGTTLSLSGGYLQHGHVCLPAVILGQYWWAQEAPDFVETEDTSSLAEKIKVFD